MSECMDGTVAAMNAKFNKGGKFDERAKFDKAG